MLGLILLTKLTAQTKLIFVTMKMITSEVPRECLHSRTSPERKGTQDADETK